MYDACPHGVVLGRCMACLAEHLAAETAILAQSAPDARVHLPQSPSQRRRMPTRAPELRVLKMTPPDSDDDPSVTVALAIVYRAVQDAQGHWSPLGAANPAQVRAEAQRWLQEERDLVALLELAGFDPAPVVERVRQTLALERETSHH